MSDEKVGGNPSWSDKFGTNDLQDDVPPGFLRFIDDEGAWALIRLSAIVGASLAVDQEGSAFVWIIDSSGTKSRFYGGEDSGATLWHDFETELTCAIDRDRCHNAMWNRGSQ